MKTKSPKRWYVVADAGRATAYLRRTEGGGYDRAAHWTSELILPEDQRPQYADRPGRLFDSLGGQRHAAETTSPAELAKQAFGRMLAQALNKGRADGAFDQLVIYAAPKLLHDLRTHVDKGTADTIVHSQAKNITKLPEQALFAVLDSTESTPTARGKPRRSTVARRSA
jgi:protein required for attachment to host cells